MSKKFLYFYLTLTFFISILSEPSCKEGENNCIKCHPLNNLCVNCINKVFTPDKDGGCVGIKKCQASENYCIKCDESSTSCSSCEQGYYPDSNGACSYSPNCEISSKGECLICQENFILIGKENELKICKYLFSDDLKNCKQINKEKGTCDICEENFYLNQNDKKCIEVENCAESHFGICSLCKNGYYLDKSDDKCKKVDENFKNCKITLDGKTCDECLDNYFLSKGDNKCSEVNFCSKINEKYDFYCDECIEGYYLSSQNICTKEEHCTFGDKETGVCTGCKEGYYLSQVDGQCYPNSEDNEFKYCTKVSSDDVCLSCENGKELSNDSKCSITKYCEAVENGDCTNCQNNYFLSKDKYCVKTDKCLLSSFNFCTRCIENYYLNKNSNQCTEINEDMLNCKLSDYDGKLCDECIEGFYLSRADKKCYSNEEKNQFYKCKYSNNEGTKCSICDDDYYLNSKDSLCSKVENCAVQENENKCAECDEDFCLDLAKGTCEDKKKAPKEEDKKIYFMCNKTNEEGTECGECMEGYDIEKGLCVNNFDCIKKENGVCVECTKLKDDGFEMCINKDYGCVETYAYDCLICEDSLDFDTCTKCNDGFELDEYNYCEKIE